MIHKATIDDLDRCMDIAERVYPPFEVGRSKAWVEAMIARDHPDMLLCCNDVAFGVATLNRSFYMPDRVRGIAVFLAGEPGRPFAVCSVLRYMIEWSQRAGAASFHFGEDTGLNMAPIAKRVGAALDRPSYVVLLDGKDR